MKHASVPSIHPSSPINQPLTILSHENQQAPEAELWPDPTPPYTRDDFRRLDEGDDTWFYEEPKVCLGV